MLLGDFDLNLDCTDVTLVTDLNIDCTDVTLVCEDGQEEIPCVTRGH